MHLEGKMKEAPRVLAIASLLFAGCADVQTLEEEAPAPYKAIVVFHWADEVKNGSNLTSTTSANPVSEPASQEPTPAHPEILADEIKSAQQTAEFRQGVEDKILLSLKDYQVFSDFVRWEGVSKDTTAVAALAEKENADLVLELHIAEVANWHQQRPTIEAGPATLETFLWIGTGIGAWWVPDLQFSTKSDVKMLCKRTKHQESTIVGLTESPAAVESPSDWSFKEHLSSGKYRLSFWNRAKPWSVPWIYLLTILIPPFALPAYDQDEAQESLNSAALEDIQREVARNLKGGHLGACGAPMLFRLKEPANGAVFQGDSVKLDYLYTVEPGFDKHLQTPLRALYVDVKRADQTDYERRHTYTGDAIAAINERILNQSINQVKIGDLGPGTNSIRFIALTDTGAEWITNTVVLLRQ